MKAWMLCFAASSFVTGATIAAAEDGPVLVTAPVAKVFVPLGFDDNDAAEVVVHGEFPNTCYKTGPATASVDAAGVVTLDVQAYQYVGAMCAQVLVPFTQTLKVGTLPEGTYAVRVANRPDVTAPDLVIGRARSANPDDFLYAPVASVALDETSPGQFSVRLEGEYPFTFVGCMVIRQVRTYMSPGNTLVVLPVAELTDGDDCDPQAFTKKFVVNQPVGALAADEYLVHVRVLEGSSLNLFADLAH